MKNYDEAYDLVNPFFKMKELDILDLFNGLSNEAIRYDAEDSDHSYLFVPGERKDKGALLVAHVDTVWHDADQLEVGYAQEYGVFYSKTRKKGVSKKGTPFVGGLGIGADDRAGVAAIWALRGLGHSILLVSGEEHGCLGSTFLMGNKDMAAAIQQHTFIMQFDRNGKDDLVFYDVGTNRFKKYCERKLPGFTEAMGTSTDIRFLCEDICGVNISIGYRNEHTQGELLRLDWWNNTVQTVKRLLSGEVERFER